LACRACDILAPARVWQADAFASASISPMLRRGGLKATSPLATRMVVDDKTGSSRPPLNLPVYSCNTLEVGCTVDSQTVMFSSGNCNILIQVDPTYICGLIWSFAAKCSCSCGGSSTKHCKGSCSCGCSCGWPLRPCPECLCPFCRGCI